MASIAKKQGIAETASQKMESGANTSLGPEPVNAQELLSIYALLADMARRHSIPQETTLAKIGVQFGVDHVSKIRRQDFHRLMEFIGDLRFDEIRSKR